MKRRTFLFIALMLSCLLLYAARDLRVADTRTMGLGGNGVSLSPLFNPAINAEIRTRQCRFDYYNRFSMRGLNSVSAAVVIPNNSTPFACHILSFGNDLYRERLFRLSAAKRVSGAWSLGGGVDYTWLQSSLFEAAHSSLAVDLGVTYHPVENMLIGLSVISIPTVSLNGKRADKGALTPLSILSGFNYQLINEVLITASLEYKRSLPLSLSMGLEYRAFSFFYLRCGLQTAPMRPAVGASFHFASFMIDLMLHYQPPLGVSFGVGLSYSF